MAIYAYSRTSPKGSTQTMWIEYHDQKPPDEQAGGWKLDMESTKAVDEVVLDGADVMVPPRKGWPLVSEAAAVHPSQIQEARDHNARSGVRPTQYRGDGSPILQDRAHRREYMKAWGIHDRNGGYGDG